MSQGRIIHFHISITRPIACLAIFVSLAATASDVEHRVKGGYLFNFTKFVEWPASAFQSPDSPIVICILGEDPFGPEFDEAMRGEVSQGNRRIRLQRIKRVEDAAGANIVFISGGEERRNPEVLKQLMRMPNILTVGEGDGFARRGGVISFVIVGGKVRFIINVDAERRAGLKISSALKQVATEIAHERDERGP